MDDREDEERSFLLICLDWSAWMQLGLEKGDDGGDDEEVQEDYLVGDLLVGERGGKLLQGP